VLAHSTPHNMDFLDLLAHDLPAGLSNALDPAKCRGIFPSPEIPIMSQMTIPALGQGKRRKTTSTRYAAVGFVEH
jgi:hypothetical protein